MAGDTPSFDRVVAALRYLLREGGDRVDAQETELTTLSSVSTSYPDSPLASQPRVSTTPCVTSYPLVLRNTSNAPSHTCESASAMQRR